MEDEKANDQVASLLMVNGLDYRMPPSLSVAVTRSHASYNSNQQEYLPGQAINVVMSNGAQYVNFRESYIRFRVTMTGDSRANNAAPFPYDRWAFSQQAVQPKYMADNQLNVPARNGVTNLFNALRWIHSSGTLIEEMPQDMALWTYIKNRYTMPSDEVWSTGSLMEFGVVNTGQDVYHVALTAGTVPAAVPASSYEYVVPLSVLADCFNQQQLCPSFISAGSRLELQLSPFVQAFTRISNATPLPPAVSPVVGDAPLDPVNTSYKIDRFSLVLQQVQLTDAIVRALSNISASSGLEYPFVSIATNTTINSNDRGSIQQSRALSRANAVIVARREATQVSGATQADRASFCPSGLIGTDLISPVPGIAEYSVQLAGQTIPLAPISTPKEAMWHALVAFGHAFDPSTCTPVSYLNFKGVGDFTGAIATNWSVSDAIYCVSLETSSNLNQSGTSLSSQRVLVFDYRAPQPVLGGQAVYTMYTPHVRLATAFLDSLIVRT